jgi:integrase
LPDWDSLVGLADELVQRSANQYRGWGDVVMFAACSAARIGEVSGVRAGDIDTGSWNWVVRRQTTPSPGGLLDKGTKGKRARTVPIIEEIRDLVRRRVECATSPAWIFHGCDRGGPLVGGSGFLIMDSVW